MDLLHAHFDYNLFYEIDSYNGFHLQHLSMGNLLCQTGKIIACDPFATLGNALPFTKEISPGSYPVTACISSGMDTLKRFALIKIDFSNKKAIEWEMAITKEDNIHLLQKHDEYFGFTSLSGYACFADNAAQLDFSRYSKEFCISQKEENLFAEVFIPLLQQDKFNLGDICTWLNFPIPPASTLLNDKNHLLNELDFYQPQDEKEKKHQPPSVIIPNKDMNNYDSQHCNNLIIAYSARGDANHYPCYWGLDEEGNICSLVMDFLVCIEMESVNFDPIGLN